MNTTKAKRGDLVVIERTTHDYVIGQGVSARTDYRVFEVTGITRDGQVRAVRDLAYDGGGYEITRIVGFSGRWLLPATQVDKAKAQSAVRAHTWPQHDSPMPFPSLDAVREALRDCRV